MQRVRRSLVFVNHVTVKCRNTRQSSAVTKRALFRVPTTLCTPWLSCDRTMQGHTWRTLQHALGASNSRDSTDESNRTVPPTAFVNALRPRSVRTSASEDSQWDYSRGKSWRDIARKSGLPQPSPLRYFVTINWPYTALYGQHICFKTIDRYTNCTSIYRILMVCSFYIITCHLENLTPQDLSCVRFSTSV